jgi:hypothetical protein
MGPPVANGSPTYDLNVFALDGTFIGTIHLTGVGATISPGRGGPIQIDRSPSIGGPPLGKRERLALDSGQIGR